MSGYLNLPLKIVLLVTTRLLVHSSYTAIVHPINDKLTLEFLPALSKQAGN